MPDYTVLKSTQLEIETSRSLKRLMPRLEARFGDQTDGADWQIFVDRLNAHFPDLFRLLVELHGSRYDFFYYLEQVLTLAAESWQQRPDELKQLDSRREADPRWFQSEKMLGGVCYVDLFAGDLTGLREKIPYFQELGLTYLHLMPLFDAPEGESDGGYAISDYRQVEPRLGTMAQLQELATDLRQAGISLVLDFVFNHTSDEHRWAQAAKAGDPDYVDYYFVFRRPGGT